MLDSFQRADFIQHFTKEEKNRVERANVYSNVFIKNNKRRSIHLIITSIIKKKQAL